MHHCFCLKGLAETLGPSQGLLTFHPQWQLIADRLALVVYGTARIVPGVVFRNLLEYQALIRANDAGGCIVLQMNTLKLNGYIILDENCKR